MTKTTLSDQEMVDWANAAIERAAEKDAEIERLRVENKKLATAAIEKPPYKADLHTRIEQLEKIEAAAIEATTKDEYGLLSVEALWKLIEALNTGGEKECPECHGRGFTLFAPNGVNERVEQMQCEYCNETGSVSDKSVSDHHLRRAEGGTGTGWLVMTDLQDRLREQLGAIVACGPDGIEMMSGKHLQGVFQKSLDALDAKDAEIERLRDWESVAMGQCRLIERMQPVIDAARDLTQGVAFVLMHIRDPAGLIEQSRLDQLRKSLNRSGEALDTYDKVEEPK